MPEGVSDLREEAISRARTRLREIERNSAKYDSDFQTFAGDCLKIRPTEGGEILFRLNEVQQKVDAAADDQMARKGRIRLLVLKARQPGVSTYVEGRFFWRTSRSDGLRAFILTHKDEATDNLFGMAKRFQESCPVDQRPDTVASNAKELRFVTGSSYRVGTAKAEGVGRSDTIQLFHGSEVAWWPNADKHAAGALRAVHDVPGTEIWLESTANGRTGMFFNMVQAARKGEGEYELVFIPWFDHSVYQKPAPDDWQIPGAWSEYAALYDLERDQLKWAYDTNSNLATSIGAPLDEPCWLFKQEYPANVDEAFQAGGDDSFIRPEIVIAARQADYPDDDFESPLILGVDVAHGGGDRTRVIDRCGRRMGHVVNETWDESDEMVMAGMLSRLIDQHDPDMVFVDVTGGYGAGIVDRLKEQNYRCLRGINFGSKAMDPLKFANKRSEMWDGLRSWLTEGADTVVDESLEIDITAPTAKPDSSGRLVLEKKEDIRKRLSLSPDGGDAAALTFAENVRRRDSQHMPTTTQSNYAVLGR